MTLLPPNATRLERTLEAATARIGDITAPIDTLLDPFTIDIDWLAWLAWGLSLDSWDADWTELSKREAVAQSIELHRIKGTRLSVEAVLGRFDHLLRVVEWHETTPRGTPHTFEIVLPIVTAALLNSTRTTAAFAEAVIREVTRVKPLREHFVFVQQLNLAGTIGMLSRTRMVQWARQNLTLGTAPEAPWDAYLQSEDGEPLADDSDSIIETDT